MAKDPAFLFYSNDFLTGTYTMSDEQVGKYIRLLCLQHQKGVLSEKDMLKICKTYDEDIFCKFISSENGFYNEKLKEVSEKRKAYSESRKNNRKKKDINEISKTYVEHMEIENENEIVNTIKIKNGFKPDFKNYDLQLNEIQIGAAVQYMAIAKQTKVTTDTIKGLWETFKVKEFTGAKHYNNEGDIYTHFMNTLKYEKVEEQKPKPIKTNDDKAKKLLGIE